MDMKSLSLAKWSTLKNVHDIKLISSMYIWIFVVPIAVKLLSLTDDEANITIFQYSFQIPLTLPFSCSLFYFSAICFVVANVIYRFRCPSLIKDHPTYSSFVTEKKPEWHLEDYSIEIFDESFERVKSQLEDNIAEFGNDDEGWKQTLFWHIHWHADRARKFSSYSALALYAVGFILISYVILENLKWVIYYIIES